jgi:uncharacterized protein with beta-barrel porin domain
LLSPSGCSRLAAGLHLLTISFQKENRASPPPGARFIVNGATPAKNLALTSAGAELRLINGVSLLGKFDGEFAAHSQTYAGTGTVRYVW